MEKTAYYPSEGRIDEMKADNNLIMVKPKAKIKRKLSKLEIFAKSSIKAINSITHPGDSRFSLNGELNFLKLKYLDYLQRAEDSEDTEYFDEDKYIEKNVDDGGAYKDCDEIEVCLEKIGSRGAFEELYSFLDDPTKQLDPRIKYQRAAMLSLIDLKKKFEGILKE